MAFKIISAGWNCEAFMDRTFESVATQTRTDWQHCVVYDPSGDNGSLRIQQWVEGRFADHTPETIVINNEVQQGAVRNQFEGIRALSPADEDIIIFLDLDGDQFAHPHVLERLADWYYHEGSPHLLTYGSYKPIPDPGTSPPAIPFPDKVIAENSYRQFISEGGPCSFNHLRTMKGKIFNAIPPDYFKRRDGSWFTAGTDYLFMLAGLELAGGRHRYITETFCLYNHANPHADNLEHPAVTRECVTEILQQTPLSPL